MPEIRRRQPHAPQPFKDYAASPAAIVAIRFPAVNIRWKCRRRDAARAFDGCLICAAVLPGGFGRRAGGAARHGDAIERHALDAAAGELRPLCASARGCSPPSSRFPRTGGRYSILGQRSITTLRPLASARRAASSLRMPSCIQITCGRGLRASASSTDRQRVLGRAKYIDHVDRLGNVGKPGIDRLTQDIPADLPRIDRDHPIAALEQIFEREIARPHVLGRDADHGDGLHGVEDAADVAVGIVVVIHGFAGCRCDECRTPGANERGEKKSASLPGVRACSAPEPTAPADRRRQVVR